MKIFNLRIFILSLFLISISFSQEFDSIPDVPENAIAPADTIVDAGIQKGLDLVYLGRYEKSLAVFDSIQRALPLHPAAYFYKAAILQTWMASYRFNKFLKDVDVYVEKVIELCEKSLEKNPNNAWTNFYLGGAFGYRAFAKMRSYNWIGAYLDGMKGIDNLKIALQKDPRMYDVYLGLGSYYYWRTARSKFIRIFAFWWSDERELGIEQYKFCMKHGRYSRREAAAALLLVYFDYGKYDKMIPILKHLESNAKGPSVSLKYMHGRWAATQKNWLETIKYFTAIYNILIKYKYQSIGYQVECQYWIGLSYHKLGRDKKARDAVALALAANLTRDPSVEMESPFESYDDILKKLEELDTELKRSETAAKQSKAPPLRAKAVGDIIE